MALVADLDPAQSKGLTMNSKGNSGGSPSRPQERPPGQMHWWDLV